MVSFYKIDSKLQLSLTKIYIIYIVFICYAWLNLCILIFPFQENVLTTHIMTEVMAPFINLLKL